MHFISLKYIWLYILKRDPLTQNSSLKVSGKCPDFALLATDFGSKGGMCRFVKNVGGKVLHFEVYNVMCKIE